MVAEGLLLDAWELVAEVLALEASVEVEEGDCCRATSCGYA